MKSSTACLTVVTLRNARTLVSCCGCGTRTGATCTSADTAASMAAISGSHSGAASALGCAGASRAAWFAPCRRASAPRSAARNALALCNGAQAARASTAKPCASSLRARQRCRSTTRRELSALPRLTRHGSAGATQPTFDGRGANEVGVNEQATSPASIAHCSNFCRRHSGGRGAPGSVCHPAPLPPGALVWLLASGRS